MAETPEEPRAVTQTIAELSDFAEYLCRIVPALLEDSDVASPALKTTIFEKNVADSIKKFLGDSQVAVLLIQRLSPKGKRCFCECRDIDQPRTDQPTCDGDESHDLISCCTSCLA